MIINLDPNNATHIEQAAALLVAGFKTFAPSAWPDLPSALEEVHEALEPEKICRVVLDETGTVVGWIGGVPHYDGRVWELHPLVVDPARQGKGIGRALVAD